MPFPRAVVPDGGVRPGYATGAAIAQYRLVKFSALGDPERVVVPTAADDPIKGVTMSAIAQDRIGDIQIAGRVICMVGTGGVTAGDRLMPESGGKVITLTAGGGTNVTCVGQAESTIAANELIEFEFTPYVSRQG